MRERKVGTSLKALFVLSMIPFLYFRCTSGSVKRFSFRPGSQEARNDTARRTSINSVGSPKLKLPTAFGIVRQAIHAWFTHSSSLSASKAASSLRLHGPSQMPLIGQQEVCGHVMYALMLQFSCTPAFTACAFMQASRKFAAMAAEAFCVRIVLAETRPAESLQLSGQHLLQMAGTQASQPAPNWSLLKVCWSR